MFRKAILPAAIPSALLLGFALFGNVMAGHFGDRDIGLWGGIIMTCFGLFIYFAPTSIAAMRGNPNYWAIFALNVFGFLGLPLIGALVWSLMPQRGAQPIGTDRNSLQSTAELARLAALRNSGALSEEEFAVAKRRVLE